MRYELEMESPENPTGRKGHWTASVDRDPGSPRQFSFSVDMKTRLIYHHPTASDICLHRSEKDGGAGATTKNTDGDINGGPCATKR